MSPASVSEYDTLLCFYQVDCINYLSFKLKDLAYLEPTRYTALFLRDDDQLLVHYQPVLWFANFGHGF